MTKLSTFTQQTLAQSNILVQAMSNRIFVCALFCLHVNFLTFPGVYSRLSIIIHDLHTGAGVLWKHLFHNPVVPQGKSIELRKSCQPSLNNETWHRSSILNLVEDGWCPPYLLPSTPINGLCVPQFALATPEEAESMSAIIERIQVSSTEMLEPKKVLEGSKYAIEKLAMRGSWEKSLHDFVNSTGLPFFSVFLSISFFYICVIFSLRMFTAAILSLVTFRLCFQYLYFIFIRT